jgi:hypothetical protein
MYGLSKNNLFASSIEVLDIITGLLSRASSLFVQLISLPQSVLKQKIQPLGYSTGETHAQKKPTSTTNKIAA